MGNRVVKDKGAVAVHPFEDEGLLMSHKQSSSSSPSNNLVRVKVRMSTRQLKELMAQVEMGKGRGLGQVILQECLEGRLSACVADWDQDRDQVSKFGRGDWMLSTICEEDQEQDHSL